MAPRSAPAPAAPTSPPAPAVAHGNTRSLREATADLFRSFQTGEPPIRRMPSRPMTGDAAMSSLIPEPHEQLPAPLDDFPAEPASPPRLSAAELDLVVDEVIERIEQRVIDELERRGLRHTAEVF
jgi:hypothetical protein